jgi:hypothetical protein
MGCPLIGVERGWGNKERDPPAYLYTQDKCVLRLPNRASPAVYEQDEALTAKTC